MTYSLSPEKLTSFLFIRTSFLEALKPSFTTSEPGIFHLPTIVSVLSRSNHSYVYNSLRMIYRGDVVYTTRLYHDAVVSCIMHDVCLHCRLTEDFELQIGTSRGENTVQYSSGFSICSLNPLCPPFRFISCTAHSPATLLTDHRRRNETNI